jgi:hypothetical protein
MGSRGDKHVYHKHVFDPKQQRESTGHDLQVQNNKDKTKKQVRRKKFMLLVILKCLL